MRYYPIFLDVAEKPVVVIGGGEIALRKVEGLLDAAAAVTVVSPDLHLELAALVDAGRVRHLRREYRPGDLAGSVLAFVATDDRSVNSTVAAEGRQRRVWVNAVDDTPNCDFIMPSILRRSGLIVAISTSGASPALARKIREELEGFLTEDFALLLEVAGEVRQELRDRGVTIDAETWNRALDGSLRRLLAAGRRREAREQLLKVLLEPAKAHEA
ncbi:MAG: bifunctional precorrin-2 dehydrogenase/sirohydrochlorin ferrochelatase [Chloroflexi bacterium]|nr:bifunctional precorrin-2 dehydrogenase/sirohydrochlorin ferrochelatase [Chloroflexota bacterium]